MQKQLVAYAFAGGIDTKTDEFHVSPLKLAALSNGVFNQTGSISKRWGYKKLGHGTIGSTASIASCFALNQFNGELVAYDGQLAYTYSPARDAWVSKGGAVSIIQQNQQITRNTAQQLSPDTGSLNGIDVYAYEDSRGGGALNYSVLDSTTGDRIQKDSVLLAGANFIRPKVLAFSAAGVVLILFLDTTAQAIGCITVNPSNPTATGGITRLVPNMGTAVFYDAQVVGNQLYLLYFSNGSTFLQAYSSSLSLLWTRTIVASAGSVGNLSVVGDPSLSAFLGTPGIWVAYTTTTATQCSVKLYDANGTPHANISNLLSGLPGNIVALTGVPLSPGDPANLTGPFPGTFRVFAEVTAGASQNHLIYTCTFAQTGQFGVQSVYARSVGLASKAFSYGGYWYVNVAFQTQQQPTYFTLDRNANVVAKVNAGLGGGLIGNSDSILPECQPISTGVFRYANLVKGIVNTESGLVLALLGVNATKLDFIDSNHFLSAAYNSGLYTVGGVLQSYAGDLYVESGFHLYPEPVAVTPIVSGGFMADGTYNYAVTYEWTDNAGLTLPSTPSVVVTATITGGGGNGSVSIVVPTLRLTKKTNVKIVVYRTTASGTLLYRVTSAIVPVYNNPAVDTVTITDTLADASITSNGLMYTQPLAITATSGNPVLPNAAPPACSLIATYANRVFLGGLDDPYLLWYSQQAIAGAPAQFSALLTLRLDPDGGGITALARMDDKLVIFKQNAIFYLVGQGPTATGDQNDFVDTVQIPSGGIGCATGSSVVLTPLGLMFDSGNGIYLLDRGLNVSYKGAPVEAYTNPNSSAFVGPITSATVLPNQWVVFTTSDPFGLQLVYDYFYDQWSTFTGTGTCVDAVTLPGEPPLLVYANANGDVYMQTPGVFTDNNSPIPLSLTTAWLDATGMKQGYQRVYEVFLLGKYKGSHTLNVDVATNYNPVFTARAAIPVDTALGISTFGSSSPFGNESLFGGGANAFPDDTNYQFRVDVVQKCESVRFRISDQQSAPGNEGFSLASLVMRVGVKGSGHKGIPGAKQFGAI